MSDSEPKSGRGETQAEHTARMARWAEEDRRALAEGKLKKSSQLPEIAFRNTATDETDGENDPALKWFAEDELRRLESAVEQGFEAGRKAERGIWIRGIAFYFGASFALWLATLVVMIVCNAPTKPPDGVWRVILDVNRGASSICFGPFLFIKFAGTAAGLALVVVGVVVYAMCIGSWIREGASKRAKLRAKG